MGDWSAGLGHHLREHRERDAVGELAELRNLLRRARLLVAEVVARESEDGEPFRRQLAIQFFESFVLRREAALAGHVDDQRHLALEDAEVGRFAIAVQVFMA
jgi:hypothetical protein